ncbi:MAG: hypothetical protein JXA33_25495 [Anaerolineae bacterium]|nr:hypothetical protein [Anaerolineae bacterium]
MNFQVKLLLTWNIKSGKESTYFNFITQDFPSILNSAGLQMTEAWYTMYGDWPQVRVVFVAEDLEILHNFLVSEAWLNVKQELFAYIQDYSQKIVPARGGFQI